MREKQQSRGMEQGRVNFYIGRVNKSEFSPELANYFAYDPPICALANKHQGRFQLFCGKERNGKKTKWDSEWT